MKNTPRLKPPLVKCPFCGCQVREDRLGRHKDDAHYHPEFRAKKIKQVAPPLKRLPAQSPLILKSYYPFEHIETSLWCDECGRAPGKLWRFAKSNRRYTVLLCESCKKVVRERSFGFISPPRPRVVKGGLSH